MEKSAAQVWSSGYDYRPYEWIPQWQKPRERRVVPPALEDSFGYKRNAESIAAEAALDGLYVVRTSLPAGKLDAEGTVRAYKRLSRVERAFRSLKSVDLKVRPIYHHAANRVRAHVLLCMLAYYVEWHMRERLKPLLFDDEGRTAWGLAQDNEALQGSDAYWRLEPDVPTSQVPGKESGNSVGCARSATSDWE